MDENNGESIQQRWDRLRQHLDEAKGEKTHPFRFSLASFLIGTTATGALIGWAVSVRGTDEGKLLALIAGLAAYVILLGCGLVLYLRNLEEYVSLRAGEAGDEPDPRDTTKSPPEDTTQEREQTHEADDEPPPA